MDDLTLSSEIENTSGDLGYETPIPNTVESSVPSSDTTQIEKEPDSSFLFNADAQAILEEAPTLEAGLSMLSESYQSKDWDNKEEAAKIAGEYAKELRFRFKDKSSYSLEDVGKISPFSLKEFSEEDPIERVNAWEKANVEFLNSTTDSDYVLVKDKLTKNIVDIGSRLRREARTDERGTVSNAIQDTFFRLVEGATAAPATLLGLDGYVKGLKERTDPSYDDDLLADITGAAGLLGGATVSAFAGPLGPASYFAAQGGGATKALGDEALEATGDVSRATIAKGIEGANQIIQTTIAGKLFSGPAKAIAARVRGIPVEQVTSGTFSRVGGAALVEAGTEAIGGMVSNYARGYGTDNPNIGTFDNVGRSALVGALFGGGIGGIDVAVNPTARVDPAVQNGGYIPPTETSIIGGTLDPETTAKMQNVGDVNPTTQGSFITKDGNIYTDTGEGNTQRTKAVTKEGYDPFDRTFFVDKGTAVKLTALRDAEQADGSLVRILTDGDKLYVKGAYVNPDLTLSQTPTGGRMVPVPIEAAASIGLHPVEVNRPKNLNGNEREYRSHIGREISEVSVPLISEGGQSVGAASIFDTLERSVGKRVRLSPVLNEKVREVFGDAELGLDRYFRLKDVDLKNQAGEVIGKQGVDGASRDFLALPDDYANPQSIEIGRQLIHSFDEAATSAYKAGDIEGFERISGVVADIAAKASRIGTNVGQTGSAFRLWHSINPATQIAGIRNELNNKAITELASEEGLDINQLKNVDKELGTITTEIKDLESEGETRLNAEVSEIESAAKSIEDSAKARSSEETQGIQEQLNSAKARIQELENEKRALETKAKEGDPEGARVKSFPKGKEKELQKLTDVVQKAESRLQEAKEPLTPKERVKVDKLRKLAAEKKAKPKKDYLNEGERARIDELIGRQERLSKVNDKLTAKKKKWQKSLSGDQSEKLTKLLKLLPTLGEGTSNYGRVFNTIQKLKLAVLGDAPSQQKRDLFYSIWNADILSNPATHFANIKGTAINTLLNPIALAATGNFGEAGAYFKGLIDAAPTALERAKIAFKTGETASRSSKVEAEKLEDLSDSKNPFLSKLGYVLRALTAEDEAFFHANKQGYARAVAYHAAKEKGLTPGSVEFDAYIGEQLFNSETDWKASMAEARVQAEALKEAGIEVTENQIKLTAWEIMDNKRAPELREASTRMSLEATLNNTPKGMFGAIYQGLNAVSNAPINFQGRQITPIKYMIPFLRTTMNMASSFLDYTPVGAYRATQKTETSYAKNLKGEQVEKAPLQRNTELGKSIIGAVSAGVVLGIAESFLDDRDPIFAIYGMGPKDLNQKMQLISEGWVPNSIKFGNTFVKFQDTPLVYALGAIGSLHDNKRWNKRYAREAGANQLGIAVMGMFGSFGSNSFLKNINTLLNTIVDEQGFNSGDKVTGVIANMGKGFTPASGALRFLSNAIDDPIDTKGDFWSKFISGIPFVETIGTKPSLNAFGEPIGRTFEERTGILARVYQRREEDPNWRWLAENGYKLPDPGGFNTTLSKANKGINKKREQTLGAAHVGVMTQEERYELTKKAGPRIKSIVERYRQRYGTSGYQEKVQERLSDEVSKAVSITKREMYLQ